MEDNAWEGPLQEFRHAELRSNTCIRLVQIHAELLRGDISCSLQQYETDTQTCPDYAALSYVWGDPTPTHTIYINDLVYRVHWNLWKFLEHRRTTKETEHTWIWTDLLCIDQAHHSEKNDQISRMGDIYARAACVISRVGDDERTEKALRTVVAFSGKVDGRYPPRYGWLSSESFQINNACDHLAFREPYWERVWVVQEVACARYCIVACGDFSLVFEDVLHKMKIAMKRTERFDDVFKRDRRIKHIKALVDLKTSIRQGKTLKFLELIEKTQSCQATRDQDRIYGLLGLASRLDPEFDSRALEVSQHKTLMDVCWDIIFMVLEGGSSTSMRNDLKALQKLFEWLPPPSKYSGLETGSSNRRSYAETASRVSEAAYSRSIQDFLGNRYTDIFASLGHVRFTENVAALKSLQKLQSGWDRVTTHVSNHEDDVPGLQTRLGWSTYAGLRFTTWNCIETKGPREFEHSLPLGWFCAAHWPDPLEQTTAKHPITDTYSIDTRPDRRYRSAYSCSGAQHDGARCDLSLVVLRIESLGVTCIMRSKNLFTIQVDFYCDCCDPST